MAEATGLPLVHDTERVRQHMDVRLVLKMRYEDVIEYQFIPFQFKDGALVILTSSPRQRRTYELCQAVFGVGADQIAELLITDLDLTLIAARTFRDDLIGDAILANLRRNPKQSAHSVFTKEQLYVIAGFLCVSVAWIYFDVKTFLIAIIALLQFYYLANVVFKTILAIAGARNEIEQPISTDELEALKDDNLPIYSILVPVYNEPEVVGHLIEALKKIDYPQHRLDVMLLLEEGDNVTLEAAKAAKPSANWRFIIVPNAQPRTKPKACNFGLFFARGKYLVIYDAEDVPESTQLKAAVLAFAKAPPEYVCFQAALNYFNASENFLTRMFTLEYSYWFDYLIPGLRSFGTPIPLGGTSNHFDTEKLRGLGGWDPFNTTEDADLGIRAAAQGYRVGFINSTTYEEANADLYLIASGRAGSRAGADVACLPQPGRAAQIDRPQGFHRVQPVHRGNARLVPERAAALGNLRLLALDAHAGRRAALSGLDPLHRPLQSDLGQLSGYIPEHDRRFSA